MHVDVKPEEREEHSDRIIGLIQVCFFSLLFTLRSNLPPFIHYVLYQPQSTHMDLNIGTAFWFASRGQGYTRSYSCEEIGDAYNVVQEDGRPLLRKGGEGHAKGRGEGRHHQQTEATPSSAAEKLLVPTSPTKSSEKKTRLECCKVGCGQISKPGCSHLLCKRCCVKRFKDETAALHARPGVDHALTATECPVHKKKKNKDKVGETETTSVDPGTLSREESYGKATRFPYQSCCRVLLVGIGADEQLAGYSRHRTVYQRGGISALVEELNMDTARIYNRNLGRWEKYIGLVLSAGFMHLMLLVGFLLVYFSEMTGVYLITAKRLGFHFWTRKLCVFFRKLL